MPGIAPSHNRLAKAPSGSLARSMSDREPSTLESRSMMGAAPTNSAWNTANIVAVRIKGPTTG